MRVKTDDLDKIYNNCIKDGLFKDKEQIDLQRIKSLLNNAKEGLKRIKIIGEDFEKENKNYSFLLRDYYDILHPLIEAIIYFDKKKCNSHQAANAYICKNFSNLDFDWNNLETIRILRNAVSYEGHFVSFEQWKTVKLPFKIYINSLIKIVLEKMQSLKS
jgi:hypothetical protein